MRVSSISLGISGREDSVNKDKGAYNLSTKAITLGVAMCHNIGPTTQHLEWGRLEPLDHTSTTDGSKALHHHVEDGPSEGQLPCQKQPKGHCWVNMSSYYNEDLIR